jgi:hypothetical protein
MWILFWLILSLAVAGCSTPLPAQAPAESMGSPASGKLSAEHIRKVGPELRRHLVLQSRRVLESPQFLNQLPPIPVVIQARRDITQALESQGGRVRSVTRNGVVVITADVPPAAIPNLLVMPDLETIELTQPIPLTEKDGE